MSNATSTAPLFSRPGTQASQGSTVGAGTGFAFEGRQGKELAYGASGSVTFYVDGTDPDGCEWDGSKNVPVSGDKLILSEDLPATASCPRSTSSPTRRRPTARPRSGT